MEDNPKKACGDLLKMATVFLVTLLITSLLNRPRPSTHEQTTARNLTLDFVTWSFSGGVTAPRTRTEEGWELPHGATPLARSERPRGERRVYDFEEKCTQVKDPTTDRLGYYEKECSCAPSSCEAVDWDFIETRRDTCWVRWRCAAVDPYYCSCHCMPVFETDWVVREVCTRVEVGSHMEPIMATYWTYERSVHDFVRIETRVGSGPLLYITYFGPDTLLAADETYYDEPACSFVEDRCDWCDDSGVVYWQPAEAIYCPKWQYHAYFFELPYRVEITREQYDTYLKRLGESVTHEMPAD